MNVLGLFDGISCGQVALHKAGIKIDRYFASEIEDKPIKVTQRNFPETIQLGDITKIDSKILDELPEIELLIGGSPCQDLSVYKYDRGEVEGLNGSKSNLFYHYERIFKYLKPKYFLLENVPMQKEWEDIITEILGVEPILINSNLVCAADRKRLYWTNIPGIEQPNDEGIILQDIVQEASEVPEKYWYNRPFTYNGDDEKVQCTLIMKGHRHMKEVYNLKGKCNTLTTCNGGNLQKKVFQDGKCRKLTPLEYERLQNLPDGYTEGICDTARYSAIGNGWTVDVIAHIFKNLKGEKTMSNEKNEVQVFEQQHMEVFQKLSDVVKTKKHLEDQEKRFKEQLEKAMDQYDIKSIDNHFVKITRVNGSTSTSVDLKAMQEKEPKLYGELLEDYPKVSTKKSYLTFKVK